MAKEYQQKDLGYARTPTTAMLRVAMPDWSMWDVPVQAIVDSRDQFYSKDDGDNEDTIAAVREGYLMASEIYDWAAGEMNWDDVSGIRQEG